MANKNFRKELIILYLIVGIIFLFIACNNKTEEIRNTTTDNQWGHMDITVGTEWNNNKPGMYYGINKNFTPWENLEERGLFKTKNGKVYVETSDKDEDYESPGCDTIKGALIIPDTITRIGKRTFYGCSFLNEVIFPNGMKHIGESAFFSCRFKDIRIPDSVETIGENAFYGARHIEYHGKATYEHDNKYWGALSMN